MTRSLAVAVAADRTGYHARYSQPQTVGCTSRGQHEYLKLKLKSVFEARSLLLMPVSFLAVRCG